MSNLVIVAIPADDDPVWKVSTEKVPHITLLYLGDNSNNPNLVMMTQFLIHAANLGLTRFGLDVDRRGELGSDRADVIFFDDRWELPMLRQFRHHLLQENNIRKAYDSVPQFEGEWIPHLTMGYPDRPAKDDAVDWPIRYVQFDKVAIWDRDYEGLELVLKKYNYDIEPGVAMDTTERGAEFLSHFGVKGMRWGVRKERTPTETRAKEVIGRTRVSKTKIKTKGGSNHPATEDAIKVALNKQKLRRSGAHTLTNQELRELQDRMNLEVNVSRLLRQQPKSNTKKVVDAALKDPEQTLKVGKTVIDTSRKLSGARRG